MTKKLILAFGMVIAMTSAALSSPIVDRAFDSTVQVQANSTYPLDPGQSPQYDSPVCSGFVAYSDRGYNIIVTAKHCTEDDYESTTDPTTVTFSDGDHAKIERVVKDPDHDIALLVVNSKHAHPMSYMHEGVDRGDNLFAIGMPHGFSWSYSPAVSTNGILPSAGDDLPLSFQGDYIITCPGCGPGSSGGPVFNNDGQVVGVYVALVQGSSTGFMVPAKYVISLLKGFH